jgi:co-chaperonin GroES (HSP10)
MVESKYLKRFEALSTPEGKETYYLRGDRLLVEVLPKVEIKSEGGLIIQSDPLQVRGEVAANSRPTLVMVLAVGDGFVNSDGSLEDLPVQPGAILLVSEMGLKYFSVFPGLKGFTSNTIALTRLEEAHVVWDSADHFARYASLLA